MPKGAAVVCFPGLEAVAEMHIILTGSVMSCSSSLILSANDAAAAPSAALEAAFFDQGTAGFLTALAAVDLTYIQQWLS